MCAVGEVIAVFSLVSAYTSLWQSQERQGQRQRQRDQEEEEWKLTKHKSSKKNILKKNCAKCCTIITHYILTENEQDETLTRTINIYIQLHQSYHAIRLQAITSTAKLHNPSHKENKHRQLQKKKKQCNIFSQVPPWAISNFALCGFLFACQHNAGWFTESFPACDFFFFFLFFKVAHEHQFHSFRPRISPQRLSELRRLRTSVSWRVVCELVSLMYSHTIPVQHNQLTPISRLWWWWWFFLACEDFGGMFDNSFTACFFFFFSGD